MLINKTKMKQTVRSKTVHVLRSRIVFVALALLLVTGTTAAHFRYTQAQSIQDKINALEAQNRKNDAAVDRLEDQALNYKDAIAKLEAKIATLQHKIDANTAEQARLQKEITAAEAELARQKNLLGENIKAMYLEGEISTLEMLASSKDLSEFIDKEQYRNSVKDKITETLDKITKLKHQLRSQKEQIEALLQKQKTQQAQLAASRSEQNRLLSYNVNQQEAFNSKTQANQAKIAALIEQQRQANFNPDGGYYFLRFPGAVSDFNPNNYPYKNAGFSMQLGPCSHHDSWPDSPDPWGYCTRQCVSYAAWAVGASGRSIPYYYGNAKDWVAEAYAHGIPVYRTPQPGDIAISTSGAWGHAMYVESVSGNTFYTSEYNTYLTGKLSYQTRTY